MLDVGNGNTIRRLWEATESKTVLAVSEEDFFSARGELTECTTSRRAHERHFLRSPAIIKCGHQTHAVYLKDVSRTGIGLLSPVQLFPRQQFLMLLTEQIRYRLQTIRCRRVGPKCYECGTVFLLK